MYITPVGAIVGLVNVIRKNAASAEIDSIWILNNHMELDSYRTVYLLEYLNHSVHE